MHIVAYDICVSKLTIISVFFSHLYQKPTRDDWKGGMDAITFSLDYQKSLNRSLLEIHQAAGENSDPHVSNLLF